MSESQENQGISAQEGRSRRLAGHNGRLVAVLAALLPIGTALYTFRAFSLVDILIYKEQFLAFFLTLCLILTFLSSPARAGEKVERTPWYDWLLAALALGSGGYVTVNYEEIINTIGFLTDDKVVVSVIAVVLLIEATRRHLGWVMVAIGLVGLLYAYFGHLTAGMFETRPIRFDRLMTFAYLNHGAILGIPLHVAATVVLAFMFFGRMLFAIGGGQAISDLAFAALGRYRGGPAKVAVMASALFGSLSGSASANVATTGMVTIPLMKRIGYSPAMAGAVEATASTGGLILPPIMAATAFVIAEFLGITYAEVVLAALLPALLYYLCIFIQVDLSAAKNGMRGLPSDQLPRLGEVARRVWPMALPAAVLLYCLFWLFLSAEAAGFYAAAAAALVGVAFPAYRMGWKAFLAVLVDTGRDAVYIGVVCALAGLVMGVLGITGLGLNMSSHLVELSGGSLVLLLLLTAIGTIVLGMGVPVTATYIILIVLVGPALEKVGITPIAAHLFVFYFGTLSFLTPPVCISVFVAAAIAQAPVTPTALRALRLAAVAYLVPFLFVFNERYLLSGSTADIALVILGSGAGVVLLSIALANHLLAPLSVVERVAMGLIALTLLIFGTTSWLVLGPALVLGVLAVVLHRARSLRPEIQGDAARS